MVPPPPPQPTWTTETPTVIRRAAPKKTESEIHCVLTQTMYEDIWGQTSSFSSWLTFVIGSDSTATSMAEELRHVLSFYSEDKAKVGATCDYHDLY